ncbi:MAG: alpha/beta hydrolase [Leptolyngbyaceae cyanobacterium RU_5_1]|nr:alpha/beta hydrolase [Leptolyngbyaceae cyanobacterium RU_5_1]
MGIGGTVREYHWVWKSKPVTVIYEVLGEGTPVLLLPAFSSVSSRTEMRGLAQQLAHQFQVVAVDWPGFGQSDRRAFNYQPALYHAFLRDFVRSVFSEPVVAIAAGHAAGYVMRLAQQQSSPWSYIILTDPTWRGPLPTAMGEHRGVYKLLRQIVGLPLLGQFLYFLNTLPWFLRWMYGRHVYANRKNISRPLIAQKWRITQKWGARFAPVAFVTGGLDPVRNRMEFIDYFQPLTVPVLIVIGEQTPPKSREEMEVVVHFSGVQVYRIPGSLGLHEEYSTELVDGILPVLNKFLS